jgi:ferredoxin
MTIKEIYEKLDSIGSLTFSTIENGEVYSRIAHLNGYDDKGIYFRTMWNKPYARQLKATKKLTICGISDSRILGHNEDGAPDFPPGYTIRLMGDVEFVSEEEIRKLGKDNEMLKLAVYDMDKYKAMRQGNFRMYKAKGELFDYDFEMVNRDHKLLRTRFAFGGATYNKVGPTITNKCIECGACLRGCSFKAIEAGSPYRIRPERCDDCGDCMTNCPVDAIELSKPL